MLRRATPATLGETPVRVLDWIDWAALKLREARDAPVEAGRHLADVRQVDRLLKLDRARLAEVAAALGAAEQFGAFVRADAC